MAKERFDHPLGLRYGEYLVLAGAAAAHRLVGNGHFLPNPYWHKAAKRMILRGFLTEVPDQLHAVVMTGANRRRYNRALKKALDKQEPASGQEQA